MKKIGDEVAVVFAGDTHINHEYGLSPISFTKENGDVVKANPARKALAGYWHWFLDKTWETVGDLPVVWFWMGDLTEFDAKGRNESELISHNPADTIEMAHQIIGPVAQRVDRQVFMRGTPAHTGKGAWSEEYIARDYDNTVWNTGEQASHWHFYGQVGRFTFDVGHSASIGRQTRTRGGGAARNAFDMAAEYMMEWGTDAPDFAVRAHNHKFADSGRTYQTRFISNYCFQLKSIYTAYINKAFEKPHIGGVVLLCRGDEYDFKNLRVPISRGKVRRVT